MVVLAVWVVRFYLWLFPTSGFKRLWLAVQRDYDLLHALLVYAFGLFGFGFFNQLLEKLLRQRFLAWQQEIRLRHYLQVVLAITLIIAAVEFGLFAVHVMGFE